MKTGPSSRKARSRGSTSSRSSSSTPATRSWSRRPPTSARCRCSASSARASPSCPATRTACGPTRSRTRCGAGRSSCISPPRSRIRAASAIPRRGGARCARSSAAQRWSSSRTIRTATSGSTRHRPRRSCSGTSRRAPSTSEASRRPRPPACASASCSGRPRSSAAASSRSRRRISRPTRSASTCSSTCLGHEGFARHVEGLRREYRARRDALDGGLAASLGDRLSWNRPGGGMFLWARIGGGGDAAELLTHALAEGLAFVPGGEFHPEGEGKATLRLNFTHSAPARIAEGVSRLRARVRAVGAESQPLLAASAAPDGDGPRSRSAVAARRRSGSTGNGDTRRGPPRDPHRGVGRDDDGGHRYRRRDGMPVALQRAPLRRPEERDPAGGHDAARGEDTPRAIRPFRAGASHATRRPAATASRVPRKKSHAPAAPPTSPGKSTRSRGILHAPVPESSEVRRERRLEPTGSRVRGCGRSKRHACSAWRGRRRRAWSSSVRARRVKRSKMFSSGP